MLKQCIVSFPIYSSLFLSKQTNTVKENKLNAWKVINCMHEGTGVHCLIEFSVDYSLGIDFDHQTSLIPVARVFYLCF